MKVGDLIKTHKNEQAVITAIHGNKMKFFEIRFTCGRVRSSYPSWWAITATS